MFIRARLWEVIYLLALNGQKESFEPLGEIRNLNYLNQVSCFYSWDSLDFSSVASRRIYIPRIRVYLCYLWEF